jgi:sugar/nucleoside kinase (ribokinase family)
MRDFHVCGLGNAIVDIFVEVSDEEFAKLGFERGTMRLVDTGDQRRLLSQFHDRDPRLSSGGSVANSIIALSQLGGRGAFIGCVGDDRYGLFYQNEFENLGIDFGNPVIFGEQTGTCVCVITPEAERTMRTCLGVASHLSARHVSEERIRNSDWLFIEGYVLANPDTGQAAVQEALKLADRHGTKIALTCSEAFVVEAFSDAFLEAMKQTRLLFCNAAEACAVTKATNAGEAFGRLKTLVPECIVTDGANGAYVRYGGVEAHVPAYPCEPKDMTGAGDMLAGAFLYGITQGIAPQRVARAACYLAMKVITQVGARLHHGTRSLWVHALNEG